MEKIYKAQISFVPVLGYLDTYTQRLNEKILKHVIQYDLRVSTQFIKKNSVLYFRDVLWSPNKNTLFARFKTSEDILICIPYNELNNFVKEINENTN